ncbi:MAG: hypothetical protein ABJF23_12485 [Bryobacteraceae bacterium]
MRSIAIHFLVLIAVVGALRAAPERKGDPGAEIVAKYLTSSQKQQETLRGMQMEVQISADLPKLHKTGKMSALRVISKLGKISYKMLGFSGDDTVKKDVIARYLSAETETQRNNSEYAITPANYRFKYKGFLEQSGNQIYLFELKPRKKRIGLFKGELWLDAKTCMPIKEEGEFVKNPSVFLKKVEFVRDYQIQDGVAIPKHIESKVDTRIVGRADITIDFTNLRKLEPEEAVEEARATQ